MMHNTYHFRLYLTKEQQETINQIIGSCAMFIIATCKRRNLLEGGFLCKTM
ncbi:MAG: helix-turn-helix domain-containing protein [Dethiobacter sp.]|nr:helix-turn-helix domain-containing protein [Dethiobacter sp.]